VYRPWGNIDWIFDRLQNKEWAFLGCLSGEDRCLTAFKQLKTKLISANFVKIFDEDPISADDEKLVLNKRAKEAIDLGAALSCVTDAELLASADKIERWFDNAASQTDSIVIDITSLPKRWFFLMLRLALTEGSLKNVVVTYSLGEEYASTISFNPEMPRALPGFAPMSDRSYCDVAFIGVGYHATTILELFDIEKPRDIKMLFPFPPGPPGIRKNWSFVRRIEGVLKPNYNELVQDEGKINHVHVAAVDASLNFNAMMRITDGGRLTSLMAPYGPKPVSLAMCLFSIAAERSTQPEVPVYYSQPTRYSINYTTGVPIRNGRDMSYAYPIRLNGRDLYTL
jgi:hypothetical protein